MKTLIIVSIPGAALSLELCDFPAGGPVEGRVYEFEGKLYKASQIFETLGVRGLMGNHVGPEMRFLSFADAVCGGDMALKQRILKASKVGQNGLEDVVSAGGIIIATTDTSKEAGHESGLAEPYDHLIFVKAVPAEKQGPVLPRMSLTQSLMAAPELGDESGEPAETTNGPVDARTVILG